MEQGSPPASWPGSRPSGKAEPEPKLPRPLFADETLVPTRSGSGESVVRQFVFGSSLNYLAAWKSTPTVSSPAASDHAAHPMGGRSCLRHCLQTRGGGGSTWPGSYHGLSVPRYGRGTYPSLSVSRYGWAGRFAPSKASSRPTKTPTGSRPQAIP